jgi:hypothetical protein
LGNLTTPKSVQKLQMALHEACSRIKPRPAQPIYRAIAPHQSGRFAVADERINLRFASSLHFARMVSDVAEWWLTRTTKARPELDGFQMERRQFFQPTVLSVAATILGIAPTAATHLPFLQEHNMSDPTPLTISTCPGRSLDKSRRPTSSRWGAGGEGLLHHVLRQRARHAIYELSVIDWTNSPSSTGRQSLKAVQLGWRGSSTWQWRPEGSELSV